MQIARLGGQRAVNGFTMIELMIVLVVMGILAAIAYPMYSDYVTRSRIIDGTTKLGDFRTQMEKYFMDNRTYLGLGPLGCGILDPAVAANDNFKITCARAPGPPETYTVTATGQVARGMSGFTYTVTEANAKTSAGPGGKYMNAGCWAVRKDGSC